MCTDYGKLTRHPPFSSLRCTNKDNKTRNHDNVNNNNHVKMRFLSFSGNAGLRHLRGQLSSLFIREGKAARKQEDSCKLS